MNDDLIRRSDVINAVWGDDINPNEDGMVFEVQSHIDRDIRLIPSADTDLSGYSARLWKNAYERGKADRPQGEWIPCSERLPEDIRPVLVTWKNTDPASYYQYIVGKHYIGTAHYHRGKWYWYSSVTEDLLAEYGKCETEEFDEAIEAVAWMPLPKPWKGADDE